MKKSDCYECGRKNEPTARDRNKVCLIDQAHNCHWFECECGHKYWRHIPSNDPPLYSGYTPFECFGYAPGGSR